MSKFTLSHLTTLILLLMLNVFGSCTTTNLLFVLSPLRSKQSTVFRKQFRFDCRHKRLGQIFSLCNLKCQPSFVTSLAKSLCASWPVKLETALLAFNGVPPFENIFQLLSFSKYMVFFKNILE